MSVPFIDVSNNNGPIDWQRVVDQGGIRGALVKATEGTYYHDPYFHGHYGQCMNHELWRGAYHFARPGRGPSGADEARYFLEYVDMSPMLQGDMFALDLEYGKGQPAPGTDLGAYALDFCQTVEAVTGVKPIIYSTTYQLNDWKCNTPELAAYPLWLAGPGLAKAPAPPSNWDSVLFWQYSWHGTVPGIQGNVDLDYAQVASEDDLYPYGAP